MPILTFDYLTTIPDQILSMSLSYMFALFFGILIIAILLYRYRAFKTCFIAIIIFTFFSALCFLGTHIFHANKDFFANYYGEPNELEGIFTPIGVFFSSIASLGAVTAIFLQYRQFNKQQFESTFFNLINIHRGNANLLTNHDIKQCIFYNTYQSIKKYYAVITNSAKKDTISREEEYLIDEAIGQLIQEDNTLSDYKLALYICLEIAIAEKQIILSKYFHNLYHLIKFTENSAPFFKKKLYYGIIRAQLNPYETCLLYYNTLISEECDESLENDKFKNLIEKTAMLHNIKKKMLFDNNKIGEYKDTAYAYPSATFKNRAILSFKARATPTKKTLKYFLELLDDTFYIR